MKIFPTLFVASKSVKAVGELQQESRFKAQLQFRHLWRQKKIKSILP